VKSMGVSSRESWAYRLTDGTASYWQSCGTQGGFSFCCLRCEESIYASTVKSEKDIEILDSELLVNLVK
jgi:hypothetical protein